MLLSKMRRTMYEDEAGQALVLGAFTVMILAMSILITAQLGHAINERIQVQNAADAGAYSVAAAVARSMNFMAWVNRANIVHYVSMMTLQSIISAATAIHLFTGLASDTLQTIASITCFIARAAQVCIAVCGAIPFVGAALVAAAKVLYQLANAASQAAEKAAKALRQLTDNALAKAIQVADTALAPIIGVISAATYGFGAVQRGYRYATGAALTAIGVGENFQSRIMKAIAGPEINTGTVGAAYNVAMGALNGIDTYLGMFDTKGSEAIPLGGSKAYDSGDPGPNQNDKPEAVAERTMAELANATRYSPVGSGINKFETHRKMVPDFLKYVGIQHAGAARLVMPMDGQTLSQDDVNAVAPSGGNPAEKCMQEQENCSKAGPNCEKYQAEATQKEAEAAQKESQCASAPACQEDPDCSQCKDAEKARKAANSAADKAEKECEKRERACDKAMDECENVKPPPSSGLASVKYKNHVFHHDTHRTHWSRGSALAASDWVKAQFLGMSFLSGGGGMKIVGVQAHYNSDFRLHCKYDGRTLTPTGICPDYAWTKPIKCEKESIHYFMGITPYVNFKFDNPDNPDPRKEINRLSYWGLVNKPPEAARLPADLAFGFDSSGTFTFGGTGQQVTIKEMNQVGRGIGGQLTGLNAWSRAVVYYHRPNAWAEPPNLFNPYWRPKLAPVQPYLDSIPGIGFIANELFDSLTH